jgi:hypothetical protein
LTACNTFAAVPATFQLLSAPFENRALSVPFENFVNFENPDATTRRQRMLEALRDPHRLATPPADLTGTPAASKAAGSSGKRKSGADTRKRRKRRKKKKKKRRRYSSSGSSYSSDSDSSR